MTFPAQATPLERVIPLPASVLPSTGQFVLNPEAVIMVDPGSDELLLTGEYLAEKLRPSTGYALEVLPAQGNPSQGSIRLTLTGSHPSLGEEGYRLNITPNEVVLSAYHPAGLFHGLQTIRQLLPPAVEASSLRSGPWTIPAGTIGDIPRFAYRSAMLDVARHFFSIQDLEKFIDLMAYYKLNVFHLHLTDDQGWRLMLDSWPNLALYGGSTAVNGDRGGFYTQDEYAGLVDYARRRYITIVPEVDMPGHTNAALASYPELNCSGVAPALYTGTEVGFSTLCVDKEITYQFVSEVVAEIAALTPGPYFHIGGDESHSTDHADYIRFIERVQQIVQQYGKQMIGWEEISQARLLPTTIAQAWKSNEVSKAVAQGAQVILSPAPNTYLDMKYNPQTPLGLYWAGLVEVKNAYDWDPGAYFSGVHEKDILGVEAPMWTETLRTSQDLEYMAYPRLTGIAEVGWSLQALRSWENYRTRLASHGPRLEALGVNFYHSPQVPWEK